jgi:hypothetical protein
MTGHFVLRCTTLATAFLLFATGAANAACSIDETSVSPAADEVLPTMDPGHGFSFVATGDCRTRLFSVQDTALTKWPTRWPSPRTDHKYTVFLTPSEWDSVVDESTTTFTWSITAYGPGGLPIAQVTTTNEIDSDGDGWTRSDGDIGECDLSSRINPGVEESCNRVDDNCSGDVDEDLCQYFSPTGYRSDLRDYQCRDGVWRTVDDCP